MLPILLVFSSLMLNAQSNNEVLISWSEDRPLTWLDYKGKPRKDSDAAASTATYLGFDYNISQIGLSYRITCSFSSTKSWGLHKTDYILAHEQGHFDIAEIFARKLHQQISNYKFNRRTYRDDLARIYHSVTSEKDAFQNQYDSETNHSINKTKQEEWLRRIDQLLHEYQAYAGYNP